MMPAHEFLRRLSERIYAMRRARRSAAAARARGSHMSYMPRML